MAVRNFAADNSEIRSPSTGLALTGAFTLATLAKRNSTGAWHSMMAGHDSSGNYQWEFGFEQSGNWPIFYSVAGNAGSRTNTAGSSQITSTTTWYIIAFSKPAGTTLGAWYIFDLTAGTWATPLVTAYLSTPGNPASIASGSIRFGEAQDVDDYNGRLALGAACDTALSSGQVQALSTNLATTDWDAAFAGGEVWEFNQGTNTADVVGRLQGLTATGSISGTTDNTGTAGTTVVTTDDPPGWTFGGGAAPAEAPILVMAPSRR